MSTNAHMDVTDQAQLARDVLSLAESAGMPASYWLTDTRIVRACAALGITPEQAQRTDWTPET